jgi:GH18 family chitinase
MVLIAAMGFGLLATANDFKVIGYSMNPASEIVRTHSALYITDLIYFSLEVNPDGTIDTRHLTPEGLDAVKMLADEHGIRIHVAVGGWGRSENFDKVSATPESRAAFIQNLVDLCQAHDFHGVDLDWEFPESPEEYAAYATLLVETKAAFRPHGLELSAALSPWQKLEPEAYEALDRVHLMAYDFPKKHSTFEDSRKAVSKFLSFNIPKEKLFMGVPFYGRAIDNHDQSITYRTLSDRHDLAPETDEIAGFYFNGPFTIARKARYAKDNELGGIMIWELGQDTTGSRSLLKAIEFALQH